MRNVLFSMLFKKKKDIFLRSHVHHKIYMCGGTPVCPPRACEDGEREMWWEQKNKKGPTTHQQVDKLTQKSSTPQAFLNSRCTRFLRKTLKGKKRFEKQTCRPRCLARNTINTNNCRSEAASGRPLRLPRRRARLLFLLLRPEEEEEKRL